MTITASLVKECRERTGAGMMECKRALVEANGDIEVAIDVMRKAGQAKASKKAGRIAAEGIIAIALSKDNQQGFMVEVNCETDFVARDTHFQQFAQEVVERGLTEKLTDIAALPEIEKARHDLVAKLGENITVRRGIYMKGSAIIGRYLHGVRIGVMVDLDVDNAELAKDVAMHIAASHPQVVSPDQVPEAQLAKEREIFTAQAQDSGKPEPIIEKMVDGRIKKFLNEVSLVGQPFVKNPDQTVEALLKEAKANVVSFHRFEVGEGIEKRQDDFAEEVKAISGK